MHESRAAFAPHSLRTRPDHRRAILRGSSGPLPGAGPARRCPDAACAPSSRIEASRLAGRCRVIGDDLRGHAQSEGATSGGYSLAAHERDQQAELQKMVPPDQRGAMDGGVILFKADPRDDDADSDSPCHEVRNLLDGLPDREDLTLRGLGHLVALPEPEASAGRLSQWAQRVGGARGRDRQRT